MKAVYAKNQSDLAKELGVTRSTISRARKEPGNPGVQEDGLMHIERWRAYLASPDRVPPPAPPGERAAKERWMVAKAARAEHELETRKGKYGLNSEHEREVTDLVLGAKRLMLQLPAALAPQLGGMTVAEREVRLKEAMREIMVKLSKGEV